MDTYEERREWRRMIVEVRAPAIARALMTLEGQTWIVEPYTEDDDPKYYHHSPVLCSAGGDRIYLRPDDSHYRIALSGAYGQLPSGSMWMPRDAGLTDESPTVDGAKSDAKIAADIVRRLLPHYRANLAAYHARVEQDRQFREGVQTLHDRLITASKGVLVPDARTDKRESNRTINLSGGIQGISYGSLTINGANSIRLEASISPELALQIVGLLKKGKSE